MPLPRKKDEGGGTGAPVLNILQAHVRLTDVVEYTAPYTVTRKSDNAQFTLDPGFNVTVEVVDDGSDGQDNGARFFETFRYKQDTDGGWFNKENSKLGSLTKVIKPGYFNDTSIPDLTAEDLEDFEMLCQVKPKKNPNTGQITGSTIDWETMRPLPAKKQPVGKLATASEPETEDPDWDDMPF